MTDFTKFEFGASFEVLWLKSPTSPSPKTLGELPNGDYTLCLGEDSRQTFMVFTLD
jgi:hypothetical protein